MKNGSTTIADFDSRRKRRDAIQAIQTLLTNIRDAEQLYLDKVPDSLQSTESFETGENAVATLDEIIDLLADVY